MMTSPRNESGPLERAGFSSATTTKHSADVNPNRAADKDLSTIRARLCVTGGYVLHRAAADDGSLTYFVVSPWGHIQKFLDIDALRAFAEKGARA